MLVDSAADYQRLRPIPGSGPIIALMVLAEAGDLRHFRHYRQFVKFCGLDLATTKPASSGARRSSRSSATRVFGVRSGSPPRSPSANVTKLPSKYSATLHVIATMPI